jgi:16S rRNA processing protein RimM
VKTLIRYLSIGRVIAPWGVKGQLKIEPLTDDIYRFNNLKKAYLDNGQEMSELKVESVIFLGNSHVVIKFETIDTVDDAKQMRGADIKVDRKDAIKLPEGHYFTCDIVGLKVYDTDEKFLGVITDVFETGANDVYVMRGDDGGEYLIPAIKQVVIKIDLTKSLMIIEPMEGMI